MRGWILFHRELDPALPEVPEILRFQKAAAARGIELLVLKPHDFDIVAAPLEDWSVHYQGHSLERPDGRDGRTGGARGRRPRTGGRRDRHIVRRGGVSHLRGEFGAGFQGLERACAIDVPGAIFDWIEASQPAQARPLRAMTGEPLIDLVFGGRRPTATSNSSAASASSGGGDPARSSARSMLPSFS